MRCATSIVNGDLSVRCHHRLRMSHRLRHECRCYCCHCCPMKKMRNGCCSLNLNWSYSCLIVPSDLTNVRSMKRMMKTMMNPMKMRDDDPMKRSQSCSLRDGDPMKRYRESGRVSHPMSCPM